MPKKIDPEERRAALAAAAVRVIAESGLDGARLRDIAAEAGWTTGALTHYFPDKRSLLLLAMTSSLDHLQGRQDEQARLSADPLRVLLEQALPLDEDRIRHWRVTQALLVQSRSDPELAVVQRRAYRRWRRLVANLIAKDITAGRFPEGLDPEQAADEVIAMVDGVALQALYDPDRWAADKQRAFLDRYLAGLAKPG
jgi:AcrR family transcriptional regulator